uniref:hypothetical protein n=1 Tax=Arcobacter sp. TaxID=1872629 RepID=UPI003D109123
MTIKNKLILGIGTIVLTFGISTGVSVHEMKDVKDISKLTGEETVPFALLAADTKFHSCQIQQFFTDASLTQNSDAIKEAESSYKTFLNNLSKFEEMFQRENDQESLATLNNAKEIAQKLVQVGNKMVLEYGKSKSSGDMVMEEVDKFAAELGKVVDKLKLEQSDEAIMNSRLTIEKSDTTLMLSLILGLIGIVVGIIIGIVLTRQINGSLEHFKEGLLTFFAYLNRETNEAKMLKEEGNDEFAQMAKVVNENIVKTK